MRINYVLLKICASPRVSTSDKDDTDFAIVCDEAMILFQLTVPASDLFDLCYLDDES
jgi:hypothetical protein